MMSNMERERGREKRRGAGSLVCTWEILKMGVGSFLDIYVLNFDVCGQDGQTRQGKEEESGDESALCERDATHQISYILIYDVRRTTYDRI